ncbi:MAG: hypothetical protein ABID64_05230 [Nitrospirota bacterium]
MEKIGQHIGILKHEKIGYAEELLIQILETAGMVARVVNPCDVVFGNGDPFPDAVLARCELSAISDKALSAYLKYFEECRGRKIPVVNSREFLMRGQDKYSTHTALRNYLAEIGIIDDINPPTWSTHNRDRAFETGLKEVSEFGSVVIKHPCSGRGEGVYHICTEEELVDVLTSRFSDDDPILIQRTIEKERNGNGGYRDIRMWVCRNHETDEPQVVGAYYRNAAPGNFLTNIDCGALPSSIGHVDDQLAYYARLVMNATRGDVAGLDFVRDVNGKYWFEEVNIAFETSPSAVELIGSEIWHQVVRLLETKMLKGTLPE